MRGRSGLILLLFALTGAACGPAAAIASGGRQYVLDNYSWTAVLAMNIAGAAPAANSSWTARSPTLQPSQEAPEVTA